MGRVGKVLRRWRLQDGVTQEDLEKRTGLRQTYLSSLERDKFADPGFWRLSLVVEALGRTMDELKKEAEAARRQPAAA